MDTSIGQNLGELLVVLGVLLVQLLELAAQWVLLIAWIAWWLIGVNWRKAWPVLGRGGWAPLTLLMIVVALAWSRLQPGMWDWGEGVRIPAFWRQLLCVTALTASALCCGWLQGVLGWAPPEVDLEPRAHGHPGGHAHAAHH
jgi:hypothetical protein